MYDALISTIVTVREDGDSIRPFVLELHELLASIANDYEIIVVANASRDDSVALLEKLTDELDNLQVYYLSERVDDDVARIAGVEQAIGDFVVLLDLNNDIRQIPHLVEHAMERHDVVLAIPDDVEKLRPTGWTGYASRAFVWFYRKISGYDLFSDAPRYRLMSRRVVNYILQHDDVYLKYQLLPMTAGFSTFRHFYTPAVYAPHKMMRSFREAASYAVSLLLHTSSMPLRLVTITCALAAGISFLYSIYVVLIFLFKDNVAEGWTTISLQISVQFLLLSLAVGMLAEYMLHILRSTNKNPRYFIAREFRSGQMSRESKINVQGRHDHGQRS